MTAVLVLAAMLQGDSVAHEFTYRADALHQRVSVAGTFNGWNKEAWPMKAGPDGRTWRYAAKLTPGSHQYKFVLDGDKWITDPNAARNVDDGNGNINSVLLLVPTGYEKPAAIGDGAITLPALKHEQENPYLNYDQGRLYVQIRERVGDVQKTSLVVDGRAIPMRETARDDFYVHLEASTPWNRKHDFRYSFRLEDGLARADFDASGARARGAQHPTPSRPFRLSAKTHRPFEVPSWVERTVLYQIFPERFENGDKSNDPANVVPWNSAPAYYNWFGGDFAGVLKHLGHLKALGIGAIYFNPVFQGPSNHHYETADYFRVDSRLGTNAEFANMTRVLKGSGIRTILDGVFNHCGTDWAPFQDLIKNQQASPYKSWFFVKSYPVAVKENPPYEAFFGFPSLPSVNLLDPKASAYMLGVPRFWDKHADIAGWRLDTAQDAPMEFWRRFRKTVKSLGSDKWIIGENWGDSSAWLKGDQWDAAMNYGFRDAVLHFAAMGDISASECLKRLQANYRLYVPQVSRSMMNMLSSHDTPRFLTLCGSDRKLAALAAAIQFGWPGMPSIYYGEELGMEGARDPDNRRGMVWSLNRPDNPMLQTYTKLVAARRASRALQSGSPVALMADDKRQTLAFARVLNGEAAIVAANRSKSDVELTIDLSGRAPLGPGLLRQGFENVLGGERIPVSAKGSLHLRLGPESAALLIPARPRHAALRSVRQVPGPLKSEFRMQSNSLVLEAQ